MFWARSCYSCTLHKFSLKWKTSSAVMLTTPCTLVAVMPSIGERVAVSESMRRDLKRITV